MGHSIQRTTHGTSLAGSEKVRVRIFLSVGGHNSHVHPSCYLRPLFYTRHAHTSRIPSLSFRYDDA